MITQNGITFPDGQSGTAVVQQLLCELLRTLRVLPTARVGFTRCGARTRDHRREPTAAAAGVVRCCCCYGHTHAHKTSASDLWQRVYTIRRGTQQAAQALKYIPSDSDRAQTPRSTISHILQLRFTATPAMCWAAFYGIDCLSVPAAKAVGLSPAPAHLSACLFHVSPSCAIIAAATTNHRSLSQQNTHKIVFHWSSFPEFPGIYRAFREKSNKKTILRYRCCASDTKRCSISSASRQSPSGCCCTHHFLIVNFPLKIQKKI